MVPVEYQQVKTMIGSSILFSKKVEEFTAYHIRLVYVNAKRPVLKVHIHVLYPVLI